MAVQGRLVAALVLAVFTEKVSAQYNIQDRPTGIVAPDRCDSPTFPYRWLFIYWKLCRSMQKLQRQMLVPLTSTPSS